MLVSEQISCSQRRSFERTFSETALQTEDLESETTESRSRNGVLFFSKFDSDLIRFNLETYEFHAWLVCTLHMSATPKSASSD